jgi:A/G-specific adenine glycosylase
VTGRAALLSWYEPRRRAYPWRGTGDPYRVLVSEIMLQQTQAARVVPVYRSFLRRFPSIRALARASPGDVLRAWSGLGYNRRAVALHEASRAVIRDHGGRIPADLEELLRLPGVGPYTAAAVASIVFDLPAAAVDTNVARVVRRYRMGRDAAAPDEVWRAAEAWLDRRAPGEWNQAVMDLGRDVCRPVPRCTACPLARSCVFRRSGVRPEPSRRRRPGFEGSSRQLRGAIVRILRDRGSATVATLSKATRRRSEEVVGSIRVLAAEGLIRAGPSARRGAARGVVRL